MSPHPRVRPTAPPREDTPDSIDLSAAAEAANAFLTALGPPGHPGQRLRRLPSGSYLRHPARRRAASTRHGTHRRRATRRPGRNPAMTLWTLCPGHLLPIAGLARVGYVPDNLVLPALTMADAAQDLTAPPQPISLLAGRLADWPHAVTRPHGVGVIVHIEHTRPLPPSPPATKVTGVGTALRGQFRDDPGSRAEFLSLTNAPVDHGERPFGRRPR